MMYIMHTILGGWDSVIGIVLHCGLNSPGFHRGGGEVLCTGPNWLCPALRLTKLPVQWYWVFFPRGRVASAVC
jgi:hypothetical protein